MWVKWKWILWIFFALCDESKLFSLVFLVEFYLFIQQVLPTEKCFKLLHMRRRNRNEIWALFQTSSSSDSHFNLPYKRLAAEQRESLAKWKEERGESRSICSAQLYTASTTADADDDIDKRNWISLFSISLINNYQTPCAHFLFPMMSRIECEFNFAFQK